MNDGFHEWWHSFGAELYAEKIETESMLDIIRFIYNAGYISGLTKDNGDAK